MAIFLKVSQKRNQQSNWVLVYQIAEKVAPSAFSPATCISGRPENNIRSSSMSDDEVTLRKTNANNSNHGQKVPSPKKFKEDKAKVTRPQSTMKASVSNTSEERSFVGHETAREKRPNGIRPETVPAGSSGADKCEDRRPMDPMFPKLVKQRRIPFDVSSYSSYMVFEKWLICAPPTKDSSVLDKNLVDLVTAIDLTSEDGDKGSQQTLSIPEPRKARNAGHGNPIFTETNPFFEIVQSTSRNEVRLVAHNPNADLEHVYIVRFNKSPKDENGRALEIVQRFKFPEG